MTGRLKFAFMAAIMAVFACGCANRDGVMTVPVVPVPRAVPAYDGEMSVEQAKALFDTFGEVCDVEVSDTSHTVFVNMVDKDGKFIFLYTRRLALWDRGADRYFIFMGESEEARKLPMDIEEHDIPHVSRPGKEWGEIFRDDSCFKAFTVLCMDWVNRKFTPREQMMIRSNRQKLNNNNAYYISMVFGFRPTYEIEE